MTLPAARVSRMVRSATRMRWRLKRMALAELTRDLRATEPNPSFFHSNTTRMISVIALVVDPCHRRRGLLRSTSSAIIGKPPTIITLANSLSATPPAPAALHQHAESSSPSAAERWSKNPAADSAPRGRAA